MIHNHARLRWDMEALESRILLSLTYDGDVLADAAKGGKGNPAPAPAIRLDLVALHELGHSLGLEHDHGDAVSIMDPYYNADYDISYFTSGSDPAVQALQSLYADLDASGWRDSLDPTPGNGRIDLTYSFIPDGTRMDKGRSTTFVTFDAIFGSTAAWQGIIVQQLYRWADASGGKLAFTETSDDGSAFNVRGRSQNDPHFGDIRIGAHGFDGAGKTLAHAYYPPPNGYTAAGDMHFDSSENWVAGDTAGESGGADAADTTTTTQPADARVFAHRTVIATNTGTRNADLLLAEKTESLFGQSDPLL